MDINRFIAFSQRLDRIVKNIKRKEMAFMREYGLRSVHISCLLCMDKHKNGVTVTELSRECDTDKALISRTVKELCKDGFILPEQDENDKNYNKKYILSEKSTALLSKLKTVISEYICQVSGSIAPEDMKTFYLVLGELEQNIERITQ